MSLCHWGQAHDKESRTGVWLSCSLSHPCHGVAVLSATCHCHDTWLEFQSNGDDRPRTQTSTSVLVIGQLKYLLQRWGVERHCPYLKLSNSTWWNCLFLSHSCLPCLVAGCGRVVPLQRAGSYIAPRGDMRRYEDTSFLGPGKMTSTQGRP